MQESAGSLRTYLFIVGAFGTWFSASSIVRKPLGIQTAIAVIALLLAVCFLYVAARFKDLIVTAPLRIQQLVVANAIVATVNALVSLFYARAAAWNIALIATAFSLLIVWALAWYLVSNVRRLSAQAPQSISSEASAAAASLATPGWHPDPSGRHSHRYWDGAAWTENVADGGVVEVDPLGADG